MSHFYEYVKNHTRLIVGSVTSILGVAFVIWQWPTIHRSIIALGQAQWQWIVLAVAAHALSILFAALVYFFVSLKPIPYIRLAVAQSASLFTARITPASIGGAATMLRVLIASKQTAIQAGVAFSANAVVTFLGNISIIFTSLILGGRNLSDGFKIPKFIWIMPILLIIALSVIWFVPKIHTLVKSKLTEIIDTLAQYKKRKLKILFGYLSGIFVTISYMMALWLVAKSLGVTITPLAAIVTLSLGTVGAALTPLPGGVIGAEAALAAALIQFGVPTDKALAIALVYRFVTYWLPILPGYIATQFAFKKKYL